jgi:hypothetical protein
MAHLVRANAVQRWGWDVRHHAGFGFCCCRVIRRVVSRHMHDLTHADEMASKQPESVHFLRVSHASKALVLQ